MKATDLPFNKRIIIPQPLKQEVEVEIQILKQRLDNATTKYITDNRNHTASNISKEQKQGLKTLKRRKKNQEIVVFQTDKTN